MIIFLVHVLIQAHVLDYIKKCFHGARMDVGATFV